MGFTTGFLGGMTLTYSLLYMSLYMHRANRNAQRTLLSQQATLLNSVVEPAPPLPDPPAYEVRRAGMAEELKDRWNRELERMVRSVQTTDWNATRQWYEERAANLWEKVRNSDSAREVEAKAKELESKVKDSLASEAEKAKEKTKREPRLLELK